MPLVRTNNPLSQVIIRRMGDVGGPRADHVNAELDNIINWAKAAPRSIETNISTVGNVGVGLDSLHSFSLDTPNRMLTDKDWVRVAYGGVFAGNNNTKRIQVTFDSQVIFNSAARDIDIAYAWYIGIDYTRLTSTSIRASGFAMLGLVLSGTDGALDTGNSRWFYQAINGAFNVANLTSNAVTLLVQAEGTANDDIQQNISIIELRQQ